MLKRPVTSDDLARLRDERDQADRRYNEALTALDRALPRFEAAGAAIAPYDDSQVTPLNERWKILEHVALPPVRGLRSRLTHFVWSLIGPLLERQQAFNATLVDHLNRNVGAARAPQQMADATAQVLAAQAAALATFQIASHPLPAAGHGVRRHQGSARGRQPDVGVRRRPQRPHRRAAETLGVAVGARGAL